MENRQTAVEWYEKEISFLIEKYQAQEISQRDFIVMKNNLFHPAKEMEEEQIKEAFFAGIKRTGEGWNGEYANGNDIFDIEEIFKEDYEKWIKQQENGK